MIDYRASARLEGERCARRGLLPVANPYFDDLVLAAAWREGYEEARASILRLQRKLREEWLPVGINVPKHLRNFSWRF